jgi:predicted MFS family arabinose efflux permease
MTGKLDELKNDMANKLDEVSRSGSESPRDTTAVSNSCSPQYDDLEKTGQGREDPAPAATVNSDVLVKFERKQLVTMCFAMALAIFLISIDETVIVTAIPKITDEFNTIEDVGWYGSAYLLTMCCFQLHYGKFYKDYPTKWVFLTSIGLFELGSLLCGVSPNSKALILGRAIAGGGACGIVSGVLILIARSVPLTERPLYTACVSSIRIIAGVGGPLFGGGLTDSIGWRW